MKAKFLQRLSLSAVAAGLATVASIQPLYAIDYNGGNLGPDPANGIVFYDGNQPGVCAPKGSGVSKTLANLPPTATIEQKIAQTFIVGFAPDQAAIARQMAEKYHFGGIFVLGHATKDDFNKAYFDSLNSTVGTPLIVASDEEGGKVQRFENVIGAFPSAAELAAQSATAIENSGQKMGQGLAGVGVNTDLAPVLDLLTGNANNADNLGDPAHSRAFSSDPAVITTAAGAFAKGLAAGGVTPVYKHFPGIGRLPGNTDAGPQTLPSLSALQADLKPFEALVNQNNGAVMLSNALVPDWGNVPTSISPAAVTFLQSAPYSFKGLIMTDDLSVLSKYGSRAKSLPDAVAAALQAGVHAPLFKFDSDAGMQAIINKVKGLVSTEVITNADASVLAFKNGLKLTAPATALPSVCCADTPGGLLTGKDNTAQVFNYFTSTRGLSAAQAAGIVGNMIHESAVQPQRLVGTPPGTITPADQWRSGAWGIVQWNPGSKMINPTKAAGKDPNDLAVQLDFLWGQLYGSPPDLGTTSPERGAGDDLRQQTTPETAARSFALKYERFTSMVHVNDPDVQKELAKRATSARAIFVQATGGGATPPPVAAATTTTTCGGAGAAGVGGYKNPFRGLNDKSKVGRIDGGVDYGGRGGSGPVYAVGPAKIIGIRKPGSSGWPGGGRDNGGYYILYQMTDGPAKDKFIYIAEDCTPTVNVNDTVTADTVVCQYVDKSTALEIGWGDGKYGYVGWSDYPGAANNFASNSGQDMSRFLQKLGMAPAVAQGALSKKSPPPDWPKW